MYDECMHPRTIALSLVFFILGTFSIGIAYAWTGPTAAPPNGNVAVPINVGSTDQVKNGGLGVNSLAVFGNSLFGGAAGSNAYMNFGATSGSSGYGIRDHAGTIEFKNSGGSWQSIQNIVWELCGGMCGDSDGRIGNFISEATVTNSTGNKTQNIAIPSNAAVMELTTTCNYTQYAGTGSWVKYNMGDGGGDRFACHGVTGSNLSSIDTKVVPLIRGSVTLTISSHVDHYDGFARADVTVRFYEP